MVERTYVTIRKFTGIMGVTRNWYYRHVDDPGMPQRVYFGGKPMLIWQECEAYLDRAVKRRRRGPAGRPEDTSSSGNPQPSGTG